MKSWYQKILDEDDERRGTKTFYQTQGFEKMWHYYKAVIHSDKFQKTLHALRRKYDIPPNGIPLPKEGSWSSPHHSWIHHKDHVVYKKLQDEIHSITLTYGLLPKDWSDLFESYIFHNVTLVHLRPNARNLCFISDGKKKIDSLGISVSDEDTAIHPITLHISPYASKRDILDYIEKMYKFEIEQLQNAYRNPDIKIGAFKKRTGMTQRRNAFIVENAHLSRKELLRATKEKFGPESIKHLDEGSIGKIISYEQKRRQKV